MARLVKCSMRANGDDHISKLPDSVAGKIMDLLSLKEAVQTSVLSKQWKKRWLYRTSFDFDAYVLFEHRDSSIGKVPMRIFECIEGVTSLLRSRQEATRQRLSKLRIRLNLGYQSLQPVEEWLSMAFGSEVQHLELDFLNNPIPMIAIADNLIFPPFEEAYIPLTSLLLSGLKVTDEALESFLAYLPNLEHLKLCATRGLVNVRIHDCPSLKHLEILHCHRLKTVIVRKTSIISFAFTSVPHLELEDNHQLVIIRALYVLKLWDLGMFMNSLPQLQILTLCIAYKSCAPIPIPKMSGLKQLTLIIDAVQVEAIHRLTAMLRASPNLEKLALEFLFLGGFNKKALAASEKRTFALGRPMVPLERLKDLEVRGYNGDVAEDTVLRYLMEHIVAPELKPVVYDPRGLGRDYNVSHLHISLLMDKKSEEILAEQFTRAVPGSSLRR